jgi:Peptidase A4 family/Immunoglobulin I-set domain
VSGATPVPQVLVQPSDQSVQSGLPATFGTVAAGVVTSVQWQVSTDGGADWSDVANATALSYSFLAAESENGDEYRAVLSNSGGSTTTRAATLTVSAPPSPSAPQVTTQPSNQDVTSGSYATFTAAASGFPAPSVQWEVSTNGGQNWSNILGANSTSYTLHVTNQNGYDYRAVFTNLSGTATTNAAWLVVVDQSWNWSGYVATGQGFSTVTGNWTAPAVTCTGSATTYSSQWIGIDGDGDNFVEQDGTESDCLNGVPSYDAWYEMFGDDAVNGGYEVELSPANYPVAPGDAMTASVSLAGSTWTLAISDGTAGWQFSTPIVQPNPAPQQISAEWILERPEVNGSLSSLSDFGSAAFTGATATDTATSGPISSFTNEPLQMVEPAGSSYDILASPGPLNSGGTGFSVTWNGSN